jgi:sulfur carrier protein ThiS
MEIHLRAMGRFRACFPEAEMTVTVNEGVTLFEFLTQLKKYYELPIEENKDTVILVDGTPVSDLQKVLENNETVSIVHLIPGG